MAVSQSVKLLSSGMRPGAEMFKLFVESRRRHTRSLCDWSSDVCSSDLDPAAPGNVWGDPAHATLTAPFAPAERCRQIVFWAVDWQSYEDFETAPSAPVDASKYLKAEIGRASCRERA